MATEPPDPRQFETWEDAFQYPIPAVRKFEAQLRSHGEENKQRLRGLVGYGINETSECCASADALCSASYRDLLGTAERIISMDEEIQKVEGTLAATGQRCNSRAVERLFSNYTRLRQEQKGRTKDLYGLASEVKILQSCTVVIARLLKNGGPSLLTAKILVLSRLTHKTLSTRPDTPAIIETLWNRLVALRRRLLRSVDKKLACLDLETHELVEEMCAFSLATSSTPTDVLRHVHHVRVEAIRSNLEQTDNPNGNIVKSMKLYISTLHDSHVIFPKRLSDALAKLKTDPLIRQRDVQAVAELNLPIHERWLPDELRNYTPWPRHDELKLQDAQKELKFWARRALTTFFDGTKAALERENDIKELLKIRKQILEAWPWAGGRALPGLGDPGEVVNELRDLLNSQLGKVIGRSIAKLSEVSDEIYSASLAICGNPVLQGQRMQMWENSTITTDFSNGGEDFKQTILDIYHGNSEIILAMGALFENWTSTVALIQAVIKEMKDTRWDDDIGAADDNEDFDLDNKQALLSEDDPRLLEQTLKTTLSDALVKFALDIESMALELDVNDINTPGRSVFMLRVIRGVIQHSTHTSQDVQPRFSIKTTNTLHHHVARQILNPALTSYLRWARLATPSAALTSRALWESQPPLPVQPSPAAFKFLRSLSSSMATAGVDVWAPGATSVTKQEAQVSLHSQAFGDAVERIIGGAMAAVNGNDNQKPANSGEELNVGDEKKAENRESEMNGTTEPNHEGHEEEMQHYKNDALTQLLFDALYLQRALQPSRPVKRWDANEPSLEDTVTKLVAYLQLDDALQARLRKNSAEYWKKTYLLFGLLA
jgi:conserved oligomeric Golgi complex subunit 1